MNRYLAALVVVKHDFRFLVIQSMNSLLDVVRLQFIPVLGLHKVKAIHATKQRIRGIILMLMHVLWSIKNELRTYNGSYHAKQNDE